MGAEPVLRPIDIMKFSLALLLGIVLSGLTPTLAAEASSRDAGDVRQKLAQAILSEGQDQQKLMSELADSGSRTVTEILVAWSRDGIFLFNGPENTKIPVILEETEDNAGKHRALRVDDGKPLKDSQGAELRFGPTELTSADTDMSLRSAIQQTLDTLALSAPEPNSRRSAALKIGNSRKAGYLPLLQNRLVKETNSEVRKALEEAVALLQLGGTDVKAQVAAMQHLGLLRAMGCLENIRTTITKPGCAPEVVSAGRSAIRSIEEHIWWVNFFGTIFHGLSLGSVLLVVALGLAITFGLMGIINMAHGEMIAVGAYACYVVQNLFATGFGFSITFPFSVFGKPIHLGMHLPGLNATGWFYETYFLFALPLSFTAAALAGLFIERTVIRFLYRRPLESLLATWGISLVMQQCFRMVFGANNVQVNSPAWLMGHFTIEDVSFGYNRVFVIVFAIVIVIVTWLLLAKTSLGLLVRAVMQNRAMAACLGVRTARVNMLTFAFGSGLAGLAGAFLSQIGNVGPSLGQTYIVDSFMTVVLGGVGSIVGTVCSAIGIGTSDQVLQQTTGSPVTGKIIVLVAIIVFLQWKPGGLFSIRSRSLD